MDRAGGGRAGRVFNKRLANALAAGSVEYWVLSWRRSLWSTGFSLGREGRQAVGALLETDALEYWVDRAGGRAAAVGRAGRFSIRPLVNALSQRGLLNIRSSLGDGVCGALGAVLGTETVEQ